MEENTQGARLGSELTKKEYHVIGPPGTGKTTYLIRQVIAAKSNKGASSVVVVSFTRAAAAEIASRMGPNTDDFSVLGNQMMPHEGGSAATKRVGTLHSICYHLLGCPEVATTHAKDWNKTHGSKWQISQKGGTVDGEFTEGGATEGDRVLNRIQKWRAIRKERDYWPKVDRAFDKAWEDWKAENNYVDFTDMIENCLERQLGPPQGAKVLIVDEAQDFTKLELDVIRDWAQRIDTTVLAYDDDQTIYSFKGADPLALIDPPPPENMRRVLSQSYRVPRSVHAYASQWIARVQNRAEKEYEPRDEEGKVARLRMVTSKNPERMIDEVSKDLDNQQSVMVLSTCGYQLWRTITVLRKRGIPFHNPYRTTNGSWNPLRKGNKKSVCGRLDTFLQNDPAHNVDHTPIFTWTAEQLHAIAENLDQKCFLERGMKTRLKEQARVNPNEPEFLENWFKGSAIDWLEEADLNGFFKNLLASKQKSFQYAINIARRDPKALTADPNLVIGTIHSVKGGEADSVYLFPDMSPQGEQEWVGKGRDSVLRLFYVGFTRARRKLVLLDRPDASSVEW